MVQRIANTKIGDLFSIQINENEKRYLQYVVSDHTQLNSDVIRAFKRVYHTDEEPILSEVVKDEVDFYAHCVTKAGIRQGIWKKVGNVQELGNVDDILFKDKDELSRPDIQDDWYVWYVNKPIKDVRKLKGKYQKAYLGLIFQPESIEYKFKTGSYRGGNALLE